MSKRRPAAPDKATKPILLLMSRTSGRRSVRPDDVQKVFEARGCRYELASIRHPDDAETALEQRGPQNYRAVAVFGGDSTIAAVMKALAGKTMPIIILPGGTANLMAREFGVSKDLDTMLRAFQKDEYVLRYVPLAKANGRPFVFDMHFGLFTVAVNTVPPRLKKWFGEWAFRLNALKAAWRAPRYEFRLTVDGHRVMRRGYACFVLNSAGPWMFGKRIGPRPKAERLRVLVVRRKDFIATVSWLIARSITGRELPSAIKSWHARRVTIRSAPKQANFDDRPWSASLPLYISFSRKQCRVVIPRLPGKTPRDLRRWTRRHRTRYFDRLRRTISGVPPERYSRISDRLYLGGQYRPRAYSRFIARDITGIVNMRTTGSSDELPPRGIEILHLPTEDRTAPALAELEKGVAFINRHIRNGGAVYIHCHLGEGRGPTMAAAYLIATGMRPRDAIAHLQRYRPFAKPNRRQRQRLAAYARQQDA